MKKWWKNKMVWVMPLLVLVTLFLLEIPRQYYKYEDSRILEESGSSKYETQRIQGIDTFFQKVDIIRGKNGKAAIGKVTIPEQADLNETKEILFKEMTELSEGACRSIVRQMGDGEQMERGFTAQVMQFRDEGTERYVWEIGALQICNPESEWQLTFWYDKDTYKIFVVEWGCLGEANVEEDADFEEEGRVREEEVRHYYEQEPNECTLQQTEYDLLISIFTMEELGNNELLLQLSETMDYCAFVGERIS